MANADDGGMSVICTHTASQGLLCPTIFSADEAYARTLPKEVMRGYHSWAIPVTKIMEKYPILMHLFLPITLAWANEAAFRHNGSGKSNLLGKLLFKFGVPICKFLGRRM